MSIYSKSELVQRLRRFLADPNRGISRLLFAEIAGVSEGFLRKNVENGQGDISPEYQIRLSRALQAWERGEIAVMQGPRGVRFVKWRETPRPRLARSWGLRATSEGFKLDLRVKNRADYGEETLLEQMEGQNGGKTRL